MSADARVKISKEATETYHLTFNVLLPSDQGEWEVKASNELGEVSSKCVVIVEGTEKERQIFTTRYHGKLFTMHFITQGNQNLRNL